MGYHYRIKYLPPNSLGNLIHPTLDNFPVVLSGGLTADLGYEDKVERLRYTVWIITIVLCRCTVVSIRLCVDTPK